MKSRNSFFSSSSFSFFHFRIRCPFISCLLDVHALCLLCANAHECKHSTQYSVVTYFLCFYVFSILIANAHRYNIDDYSFVHFIVYVIFIVPVEMMAKKKIIEDNVPAAQCVLHCIRSMGNDQFFVCLCYDGRSVGWSHLQPCAIERRKKISGCANQLHVQQGRDEERERACVFVDNTVNIVCM